MDTQYLRPSKDASFMEIAQSVSMRSTCLRRRYGAVIVSKDGRIVSTGYNGAPRHRENCTDLKYCLREKLKIRPGTHYELCRSVHAEANAIINGNPLDIIGGTLYLAGTEAATNQPSKYISPCAMCQRLILNAQIARVVLRNENNELVSVDPLEWDDDAKLLEAYAKQQEAEQSGEEAPAAEPPASAGCGCGCGGTTLPEAKPSPSEAEDKDAAESAGCGCGCGRGAKSDAEQTSSSDKKDRIDPAKPAKKIVIDIEPAPKCRCGNHDYCRCGD